MERKLFNSPRNHSRRPQPNRLRRTAGQKKKGQNERQPGIVSDKLRRRMGDALSDIHDDYGPDIYAETVTGIKEAILNSFKEGFEQLEQQVKDELGRRGVEESREHVRAWANELVEDINHLGLDEAAAALEDFVGTLTAEYVQGEEEEDDLLEVTEDEIEEPELVEEEEIEPVEEEGEEGEEEIVDLGDLGLEVEEGEETEEEAAGSFGPTGGRRRRRRPRRHYR